jgi:hypothetical protein
MEPLFRRAPPTSAAASDAESKSGTHSSKRRKGGGGGGTGSASAEPAGPGVDSEEMMPAALSLETPLHRAAIIDRNKEYARYSQELARRVGELESYIQSLNAGTDAFSQHWATSALSLQPNTQLPLRPITTSTA